MATILEGVSRTFAEFLLIPRLTRKDQKPDQVDLSAPLSAIEANKPQIKEAVETLFNVKVKAVNTSITKGKVKRFRGMLGKRKDVKKAYVTLEEGNTIDISTGL